MAPSPSVLRILAKRGAPHSRGAASREQHGPGHGITLSAKAGGLRAQYEESKHRRDSEGRFADKPGDKSGGTGATGGAAQSGSGKVSPSDTIRVNHAGNPKKVGSLAHTSFSLYKNDMTVADYVNNHPQGKKAAMQNIAYDLKKGYISVGPKASATGAMSAPTATPPAAPHAVSKKTGIQMSDTIRVTHPTNPKKVGSLAHTSFSLYKNDMTVADYVNNHPQGKKAAMQNIAYDTNKGYISVGAAKHTQSTHKVEHQTEHKKAEHQPQPHKAEEKKAAEATPRPPEKPAPKPSVMIDSEHAKTLAKYDRDGVKKYFEGPSPHIPQSMTNDKFKATAAALGKHGYNSPEFAREFHSYATLYTGKNALDEHVPRTGQAEKHAAEKAAKEKAAAAKKVAEEKAAAKEQQVAEDAKKLPNPHDPDSEAGKAFTKVQSILEKQGQSEEYVDALAHYQAVLEKPSNKLKKPTEAEIKAAHDEMSQAVSHGTFSEFNAAQKKYIDLNKKKAAIEAQEALEAGNRDMHYPKDEIGPIPYDPDGRWNRAAGVKNWQKKERREDGSSMDYNEMYNNKSKYHKKFSTQLKHTSEAAGGDYVNNAATSFYTGTGYTAINNYHRHGTISPNPNTNKQVAEATADLDKAIANSKFENDVIMYRGMWDPKKNSAPPPDTFDDKGYSSISFSPDVSRLFSDGKNLFRVRVPKGFPGIKIAMSSPKTYEHGLLEGEAEMLLPRNTQYRVIGRQDEVAFGGKVNIIDVEPYLL